MATDGEYQLIEMTIKPGSRAVEVTDVRRECDSVLCGFAPNWPMQRRQGVFLPTRDLENKIVNTTKLSLRAARSSAIGTGAMLLGAVLVIAGLVSTTSSNAGNQSCPASGSVLIAKFNFNHQSYHFEDPPANHNVVTLTNASAAGATWSSTLAVSGVIVKGGSSSVYTTFTPPQFAGTFSNWRTAER